MLSSNFNSQAINYAENIKLTSQTPDPVFEIEFNPLFCDFSVRHYQPTW